MQTLDRLLYAWLSEQEDARFQRAFNRYFQAAFPVVVRYLARRSAIEPSQLEDLAQEALVKFFDLIGRRRRQTFGTAQACLPRIQPLNLGVFHERQVTSWRAGVEMFAQAAVKFAAEVAALIEAPLWRQELQAISAPASALCRQGAHLLHAVQLVLHIPDLPGQESGAFESASEIDLEPLRLFWQRMREEAQRATDVALHAERSHPGVFTFVDATFVVTEAIPVLRVPTNGFLFDIALNLYLDECKSRGRKKRGGQGVMASAEGIIEIAGGQRHPLDDEADMEGNDPARSDASNEFGRQDYEASQSIAGSPASDRNYEEEEFLEKFLQYLRQPVTQAEQAYVLATEHGAGKGERKKLDTVTAKFSRLVSVLSMLGEGHTQEEIAQRLSISRNQVKYVVERVQESYAEFSARTSLGAIGLSAQGRHHVR